MRRDVLVLADGDSVALMVKMKGEYRSMVTYRPQAMLRSDSFVLAA